MRKLSLIVALIVGAGLAYGDVLYWMVGDNYADDALLAGVSLVGAVARGGLQFVKLFYYSRSGDVALVQKRLDDATKTIRFELAARMNQKYVPELRFEYDDTLDRAARIDDLLNNLKD